MGIIWMPGGGGGADLDVVTAAAGDVLKDKVIVGPDGEPLTGVLELTGNAADSQVLVGKTYYNTDAKTKRTGTMPNQGAKTASLNCGGSYTIPAGYHNGSGKVTANSLVSQTDATAGAGDILSGKTGWVKGSKVTGTLATMAGQTITPSASQQTVNCSGKKMTGDIVINTIPPEYPMVYGNVVNNYTSYKKGVLVKTLSANSKGSEAAEKSISSNSDDLIDLYDEFPGERRYFLNFAVISIYGTIGTIGNFIGSSYTGGKITKADLSFGGSTWIKCYGYAGSSSEVKVVVSFEILVGRKDSSTTIHPTTLRNMVWINNTSSSQEIRIMYCLISFRGGFY